jgi:hypothetical protein
MGIRQYAIVIGNAGTNIAACVPNLPGWVETGESQREFEHLIRRAIAQHLKGMDVSPGPASQGSW